VQADITAYGVPNHITLGLAVVDGQIVVVDPHLSGPLEMMISFDDMVRVLESQLNEQMQQAGRTMHDIRIEPGRMVVVVE
jgi:tRNA splicing ligase